MAEFNLVFEENNTIEMSFQPSEDIQVVMAENGAAEWGRISGSIADQTDLVYQLNTKIHKITTHTNGDLPKISSDGSLIDSNIPAADVLVKPQIIVATGDAIACFDTDGSIKCSQTLLRSIVEKPASATSGHVAVFDSNRNITDSGKAPSDFASANGLALTDRRVDALYKVNEGQTYDFDTDTADCYSAPVPSGSVADSVKMIGGKSLVMNQLVGSSTASVTLTSGHKYYTKISGTEAIQTGSGNSVSVTGGIDMVIDLTQMGLASLTTVAQVKAILPKSYYAYNTGTIINGGTKRVDVKNSNSVVTSQTTIPNSIQSLEGYGWSAGTGASAVYNYVDYAEKKYHKRVARVDLGSLTYNYNSSYSLFIALKNSNPTIGDMKVFPYGNSNCLCSQYIAHNTNNWNYTDKSIGSGSDFSSPSNMSIVARDDSYSGNVTSFKNAMSGVYLYYELATEVITDISSLLDEGFLSAMACEGGGSVTFVSDTNDDYRIPVNNTNEFVVKLSNV